MDWLVLSGGRAVRLGRDKASTEIDGRSLLGRAVDSIKAEFPDSRVHVLGPEYGGGPAAAIVAALPSVESENVGVLAVDMPFARRVLTDLRAAVVSDGAVDAWMPVDGQGRRQWLCAVYRRVALTLAAEARADWSGSAFGALVGSLACVEIPVSEDVSLLDIDTPADLQRARAESGNEHR